MINNQYFTPPHCLNSVRKERQSNFELLRIVAMILVLMVHVNFFSVGMPDTADVISKPWQSYMRFAMESFSIVGVNVFVLISGYFGIRTRPKSIANLIFTVVYWIVLTIFMFCTTPLRAVHPETPALLTGIGHTVFNSAYWFVYAYFLLMLFAPIFNSWLSATDNRSLVRFIIVMLVVQLLGNVLLQIIGGFGSGYSVLSFIVLYCLGAYFRKHTAYLRVSPKVLCIVYLVMAAMTGAVMSVTTANLGPSLLYDAINRFCYVYNSPLVIAQSVTLFLLFAQMKIQSRIINYMAGSAFAVYLFHCSGLVAPIYKNLASSIYQNYSGLAYWCFIAGFIVTVFAIAVLLDQPRRAIWSYISRRVSVLIPARGR